MSDYARTDLALEGVGERVVEGITRTKRGKCFDITEIVIESDEHGRPFGKPKGRYITMERNELAITGEDFVEAASELAAELKQLIPEGGVLVAGLGNSQITPDALGPKTASMIFATRHLNDELPEAEEFSGLREISVISAGVLGQTGIESAEILYAICKRIKPKAIIAVDALACSDASRLGTTIQICDSGISPGSGVQNKRTELSYKSMGIPVIAVGVPTVVDMHTIIEGLTGSREGLRLPNMMVTPRNIDRLIDKSSKLLSIGINCALLPKFSPEDFESLV
ncbi:MAG: GPR endopeptidase [Oscillospiraceae bacterium]|nr:GPR endopeptidase [Oscillospiraceae bacterium]